MERRKHMNTPPCIAYTAKGRLCGKPALNLDKQRGGYVCWIHRPRLPDETPEDGPDPRGHVSDGPPCGDVEAATEFPARPRRTRRGATEGQGRLF